MRNHERDKNYKVVETADGSFSLELFSELNTAEQMHHSGGAIKESLYIYLPAVEMAHTKLNQPKILSVGLGLAVNEMISAAYAVKHNLQICIDSFESELFLTDSFVDWLKESPSEFSDIYNTNLAIIAESFNLPSQKIKTHLQQMHSNEQLRIYPTIQSPNDFEPKYNCIFYDFFSSKFNEQFWSFEFINAFLQKACSNSCIFATYAAKSTLKKALINNNFKLDNKAGFQGKRQSTFAIRLD